MTAKNIRVYFENMTTRRTTDVLLNIANDCIINNAGYDVQEHDIDCYESYTYRPKYVSNCVYISLMDYGMHTEATYYLKNDVTITANLYKMSRTDKPFSTINITDIELPALF